MPTARICLGSSRWYFLFVFYSLMTYTETFYLMERTTTSNMFANYGASKKKDYKAELLRELAADEDLYLATSTIHFLKRVKNMKFKFVTDGDVDEATTTKFDSTDVAGSRIQNKSISLKKKTLKTFDSLWNMMRTISDETLNIDKPNDHKTTIPYQLYTTKSALDEEDSNFRNKNEYKSYKQLTKTTNVSSKSKGNKWPSRKRKIKHSKHKRRKGYKSNSTDNNSNIINISVRRIMSTPASKCKYIKSEMNIVKENESSFCVTGGKHEKTLLARRIKAGLEKTEQCYKVNNTILLNLNNNGDCACRGRANNKYVEESTEYEVRELSATVMNYPTTVTNNPIVADSSTVTDNPTVTDSPIVTDIPTDNENPTVTGSPPTVTNNLTVASNPTVTDSPTTDFDKPTTQSPRKTSKIPYKPTRSPKTTSLISPKRTTITSIATTIENITTEFDDCLDPLPCGVHGIQMPKPCCLCSNNLMKGLNKAQKDKGPFSNKSTRKRMNYKGTFSSRNYAFQTTIPSNDQSSKKICFYFTQPKSTPFDRSLKTPRSITKLKKFSTLKSSRKRITSLPSSTNLFSLMRKRCSLSTSANPNERAKLNRRKCTTFKTKNNTTIYLQIRPSLNENTDAYEDDLKDTEYYEQYYEGYDECTKFVNALTSDNGNQYERESAHYDVEGSTMFPDDDHALSAYNLLNLFPFSHRKSLPTSADYEENIYNKYTSDLNPEHLESVAQRIYSLAVKLKNDLEKNRSERTFTKRKESLVKRGMEQLNKIQKRCDYLLREINNNRKACIKKLQQLLDLSKERDQVEKRIKGKLHQILDSLKNRNLK